MAFVCVSLEPAISKAEKQNNGFWLPEKTCGFQYCRYTWICQYMYNQDRKKRWCVRKIEMIVTKKKKFACYWIEKRKKQKSNTFMAREGYWILVFNNCTHLRKVCIISERCWFKLMLLIKFNLIPYLPELKAFIESFIIHFYFTSLNIQYWFNHFLLFNLSRTCFEWYIRLARIWSDMCALVFNLF